MLKAAIKEIYRETDKFMEKKIVISGWIRTIRSSKAFGFIELNDGTFFKNLQIVFEEGLPNFQEIAKLNISTAVTVEGTLVESPGSNQAFELKAEKIDVEGPCSSDYPLQKKRHSFEYLRTIAHLRPRTNTFSAVFRVKILIALCNS